jgi:transposase
MYSRRDSAAKTRMARAYEDDLRRKIFEAHAKGHGSFRKLAAVFGVSLGYVEKIFRQRLASGQPERVRYRPGPKSRLTPEVSARITILVEAHPDLTVAELRERLAHEIGVKMSWSMVRLWLGQLGLRLKKSRSTPSNETPKATASVAPSSTSASLRSIRKDSSSLTKAVSRPR